MNILNIIPKTPALLAALHAVKHGDHDQSSHSGGGGMRASDISGAANRQEVLASAADETRQAMEQTLSAYDHEDGPVWEAMLNDADEMLDGAQADLMSADIAMQEGREGDAWSSFSDAREQMDEAKSLINSVRDEVRLGQIP